MLTWMKVQSTPSPTLRRNVLYYKVDFYFNKKRFYFKDFKKLECAVYLRYLCEKYFLKEFRNTSNDDLILDYISRLNEKDKKEIENYFFHKILN